MDVMEGTGKISELRDMLSINEILRNSTGADTLLLSTGCEFLRVCIVEADPDRREFVIRRIMLCKLAHYESL